MTTYEPEPDPDELPPKPPVGDLPSDEELEAQEAPGDLEVPHEAFLSPSDASADETVDDEEADDAG